MSSIIQGMPENHKTISNIKISFRDAQENLLSLLESTFSAEIKDDFLYLFKQKSDNNDATSIQTPSQILFIPNYDLISNKTINHRGPIHQNPTKKFTCLLKSKYTNSNKGPADFIHNLFICFRTQNDLNSFKTAFSRSIISLNAKIYQYSEQELSKAGMVKFLSITSLIQDKLSSASNGLLSDMTNKSIEYCNLILLREHESYLVQLHGIDLSSSNPQVTCLLSMKLLPTTIITTYPIDSYQNLAQNGQNSNENQLSTSRDVPKKFCSKIPTNIDKTTVFSLIDFNEGICITLSCESMDETLSWVLALHAWKMQSVGKTSTHVKSVPLNRNSMVINNNNQVKNIKRLNLYQRRVGPAQTKTQIEFSTDDSSYYYSDDEYSTHDEITNNDLTDNEKQKIEIDDKLQQFEQSQNHSIQENEPIQSSDTHLLNDIHKNEDIGSAISEVRSKTETDNNSTPKETDGIQQDNEIENGNDSAKKENDSNVNGKEIENSTNNGIQSNSQDIEIENISHEKDIDCRHESNEKETHHKKENEKESQDNKLQLDISILPDSPKSLNSPKMTVESIVSDESLTFRDLDLDIELSRIHDMARKEPICQFTIPQFHYVNFKHYNTNIDLNSHISELCNCAGSNIDQFFKSFSTIDDNSTEAIIEHSINPSRNKEKDLLNCIKIDDFPSFDFDKLKSETNPVRPFIEAYSIAIQEITTYANNTHVSILKKTGIAINSLFSNEYFHSTKINDPNNMIKLSDSPQTCKLCFLLCALFLNGLNGFNSFSLEHEFLDVLLRLKTTNNAIIREIYDQVAQEKTILNQISVFVILLLNKQFLSPFLSSILNEDEWLSKFYSSSSYLRDEETIKQIIICNSILRNVIFDIPEDMEVITNSSYEDKEKFIFKPAYHYSRINDISHSNNQGERLRKLNEFFLTEIHVNSNKKGWQYLLQMKESNHVNNRDYQIFKKAINDIKNGCSGNDEKKVTEFVTNGCKCGLIHIWFIFLFTNQELARQFFPRDSIFLDLYRAKHVLSELLDIISDKTLF